MLLDLFSTIVGGLIVVIGVCITWVLTARPKLNCCPFIFDNTCDCENLEQCKYIEGKEFEHERRG